MQPKGGAMLFKENKNTCVLGERQILFAFPRYGFQTSKHLRGLSLSHALSGSRNTDFANDSRNDQNFGSPPAQLEGCLLD